MRQAIQTKFLGPTDKRGSRCKAWCAAKTIFVDWNHALNSQANHSAAARTLASKLGWTGVWSGGGVEHGYVFVTSDSDDFIV